MRVSINVSHGDLVAIAPKLPHGVVYDPSTSVLVAGSELEGAIMDLLTEIPVLEMEAFVALKAQLKQAVDVAAETERLKYITPGAGQAMTYQQKMDEVRAFAQDAEPDPTNYPLLSSEVGITASTLADVVVTVLAAYQQWQIVGAAIERVRLGTKAAIDAAETREAAEAAAVAVSWPAP